MTVIHADADLQAHLNAALAPGRQFRMSSAEVDAAFAALAQVNADASKSLIAAPSLEALALTAMRFNTTGLIGPGLTAAVALPNPFDARAEAWFEIRYDHKNQLHKRRFVDAAVFGLYGKDVAPADALAQASAIYRMYTKHGYAPTSADYAHDMIYYEAAFAGERAAAQAEINAAVQRAKQSDPANEALLSQLSGITVLSLRGELLSAANTLVGRYVYGEGVGNGQQFNTLNIQVAYDNYSLLGENTIDRTGSNSDLLIGRDNASDTIYGAGGDDVLVGLSGNDTLDGGGGNDTLIGGGGNDYLDAGSGDDFLVGDNTYTVGYSGNDTLVGGTGYDTYFFNAPCCALYGFKSTIVDSGGLGELKFSIRPGYFSATLIPTDVPSVYKDQYGDFRYLLSGNNLYMTVPGADYSNAAGSITIKGWKPGDLHITMSGSAPAPSPRSESPLVLDLGGGLAATNIANGVYFDLDGDGIAEHTSWVNGQGLLVRDLDHDGKITSGRELFGTATRLPDGSLAPDGFTALAALDSNGNGVLDSGDAAYYELAVWGDRQVANGVTDAGELKYLWDSQLQVATRSRDVSLVDANGNEVKKVGSYTDSNGQVKMVGDVWFQTDRSNTLASQIQPIPDDIRALPDLAGGGTLGSLHQAMVGDAALKSLVQQFVAAGSAAQAATLMQSILWRWSGADSHASDSRGAAIADARWLYMLEAFDGQQYAQSVGPQAGNPNPGPVGAAEIYDLCRQLFEAQYSQMVAQSRLAGLYDALDANWSRVANAFQVDYSKAVTALLAAAQADRAAGLSAIKEFVRSLAGSGQLNASAIQQLQLGFAALGADVVALVTSPPVTALPILAAELLHQGNEVLAGSADADTLYGGAGNDSLAGASGNDQLSGGIGNDTLVGGLGDDALSGNDGADVYLFGAGFGQDTIYNSDNDASGTNADEIRFDAGVAPATVAVGRVGADLVLRVNGANDSLTVKDFFVRDANSATAVERIAFADGTVWTTAQVRVMVIAGTAGNDSIVGYASDDVLAGGSGSDTLIGGDGADTLDGGAGNDVLQGGAGGNVYLFGRGDGQDTILAEWDPTAARVGTLRFKAGVAASDVTTRYVGSDLILQINGTLDSVTVKNFLTADTWWDAISPVRQIVFADGSELPFGLFAGESRTLGSAADSYIGTALADTVHGGSGNDTLSGQDGNDWVFGDDGDDSLVGGNGNDMLYGGAGGDLLDGGAGNDTLDGGSSGGYLIGGEGDDTYMWNVGTGRTDVNNSDWSSTLSGTVRVGPEILASNVFVRFEQNGYGALDLVLSSVATGDSLHIGTGRGGSYYQFGSPGQSIARVIFADGTVWDDSTLRAIQMRGTEGNDTIYDYGDSDFIDALGGDDQVTATWGDDTVLGGAGADGLSGGAGNDQLFGGDGADGLSGGDDNDRLDGGPGDDVLSGDRGDDTYYWGVGGGQDYIAGGNADAVSGTDELVIAALPSQVWVTQNTRNLLFGIVGTQDRLTVADWNYVTNPVLFYSPNVDLVSFADGTRWSFEDLKRQSLLGSDGEDVIEGFNTDDRIEGRAGNDMLYGNAGSDAIDGGAGNDYVFGGDGADTLRGGRGDDWISCGAGNDLILFDRGDGADNIGGGGENAVADVDTLRFGIGISAGDLSVVRDADSAYIVIAGGNDRVMLGGYYALAAGSDVGIDRIEFSNGTSMEAAALTALLALPRLNNAPVPGAAIPTLKAKQGGAFSFTVPVGTIIDQDAGDLITYQVSTSTGQDMPTWLLFDAQTRTLSGTPGAADRGTLALYVVGGDGYASAYVSFSVTIGATNRAPVVSLAIPDKTAAVGGAFAYTVAAGAFTDPDAGDVLTLSASQSDGTSLPTWLTFNASTRTFSGTPIAAGSMTVRVTARDAFGGMVSDDFVISALVQDLTLIGTSGADVLAGGSGNDTLNGLAGNDSLSGGAGNDRIDGGAGIDTMSGGTGNDTYVVDTATDVVTELNNEGTDLVQSSATYTLGANIENMTLTGTTAINGTGNALDNLLTGNSANNTLTGGAGNDSLDGGAGNDTMLGGVGNDTYTVNVTTDVVTEAASEGTDTVRSSVAWTLGSNVENLTLTGTAVINGTGNTLDNVLIGNGVNNTLTGAAGNDTLDGGLGNDTMLGGAGNDTFVVNVATDVVTEAANEGTDTVQSAVAWTLATNFENLTLTGSAAINGTGNAVDNILTGNSANNTLTGGAGNDTLDGAAGTDTLIGGVGADVYRFGAGYGIDTIQENDSTAGVKDAVQFAGTVLKSGVKFQQVGNNLEVLLNGTSDKLVVQSWYLGAQYHVEEFRFTDGTVVLDSQVQSLVSAMASFSAASVGNGAVETMAMKHNHMLMTNYVTSPAVM